ncbi:hypothetical protein [Alteromonas sp. C1M14]|uniref:hypothetical protein n=1 Tax=Alteromonas sp. C1M14 TaxID=2841567 RepID=UPI001C0890B2|nr:hypothetical protein [Alteromonas sp. C1M14]MBU2976767.1 hypothetical protein [Alteromonas sp. C1M14]
MARLLPPTYIFVITVFSMLLASCGKQEEGLGRYGMLDDNTPDYAAVSFMESIYHDDNIDGALALSSQSMTRILTRYHSNRNVQRHIVNLRYDEVTITPQGSNRVGRNQYAEEATVTLFFSGTYGDDKIEDLRTVKLIREDGHWKVDRIDPDHFM